MGNFEKLSVLVIVVIIVMILVVALYTWTEKPSETIQANEGGAEGTVVTDADRVMEERNPWDLEGGTDPVHFDKTDDDTSDTTSDETDVDDTSGDVDDGDDMGTGDDVDTTDTMATSDDPSVNEPWTYAVQKGDTLGHIAQRELGTVSRQREIYALNPGLDAYRLQIGQKLRMPARGNMSAMKVDGGGMTATVGGGGAVPMAGKEYVTRPGDQLRTIAKKAYGDWELWTRIFAKNFGVIDDPERLSPGVKIFIPPK